MQANEKAGIIEAELSAAADAGKVEILSRFFKTGKGQYGEGDTFIGVTVPENRKVARRHRDASFEAISLLLRSPVHETRLCALLILVQQYEHGSTEKRDEVYDFYMSNTRSINNWDLVDLSAPYIAGRHMASKPERTPLYALARSTSVWERRIAIVATLWLIRNNELDDALQLSEILLADKHDLIRKACGWMLREAGKKDKARLTAFLDKHAATMPRTTLRYAIEKFSQAERRHYMQKGKRATE